MANIKLTTDNKKQLTDAVKKYGVEKVGEQLKGKGVSYDVSTNSLNTPTPTNVDGQVKTSFNTPTNTPTDTPPPVVNKPQEGNGVKMESGERVMLSPKEEELRKKNLAITGAVVPNQEPTLKEELQSAKNNLNETEQKITELNEQQKADLEANKKADEELIKKQQEEINNMLAQNKADAERRAKETEDLLNKTKVDNQKILNTQLQNDIDAQKIEKEKNDIEKERLRTQEEMNIKTAMAQVEIQQQQSAWAFNKMGLGFSSGIILNAQKIATDGITNIVNIQTEYNYKQQELGIKNRVIDLQISKIKNDYAKSIVETNNAYASKSLEVRQNLEVQIDNINSNLLKSKQEKDREINTLLKDYRKEKIANEKSYINDIQNIKDKGLVYAKEIQNEVDKEKQLAQSKITSFISSGAWSNKSPSEKSKLAAEAGLSVSDVQAMEDKTIGDTIYTRVKEVMPEGYTVGFEQFKQIKEKIRQYTQMGYNIYDASNVAVKDVLGQTNEYKIKQKYEIDKYKPKPTGGGGGGGSSSSSGKFKLTQGVIEVEDPVTGKKTTKVVQMRTNPETGVSEPVTQLKPIGKSIGTNIDGSIMRSDTDFDYVQDYVELPKSMFNLEEELYKEINE